MEGPTVVNELHDTSRNVRYQVVAYRRLDEAELVQAVRVGLSMMKKKPKKNSVCRFVTVIGARDEV